MKQNGKFYLRTDLFYGVGSTDEALEFIKEKGYKNIYLAVDAGVAKFAPYYKEFTGKLGALDASYHETILRDNEEPSYDYLTDVANDMRKIEGLDLVIGIGGGSALDMAKTLSALYTNLGDPISYRGFHQLTVPNVDNIMIPTTAGTGSEVTINAVFTDKVENRKLGINGRYIESTYAVLDANWTMSCPYSVALSSGMDALVHTLESFMTNGATPVSRALSREAFFVLYNNLPSLKHDAKNEEKRQNLLLGAYLAGSALFNAGSGVAGGLSYPIGVHFKVPHGIAGGIVLPSLIRFNVENGYHEYAELLDMIESHADWTDEQKSVRFADLIEELAADLDVPKTMGQWGITADNLEHVTELCSGLQGAFNQNPVPFMVGDDVRWILKRHTA